MLIDPDLIRSLENIGKDKGFSVIPGELLKERSSMRLGGRCAAWCPVGDVAGLEGLCGFLEKYSLPWKIAGRGSNLLFPDENIGVVFIELTGAFREMVFSGGLLRCGSGAGLSALISWGVKNGYSGFEGLIGIPGSVGGAVVMNASYKKAISDLIESVLVMCPGGGILKKEHKDLRFGYRTSSLGKKDIVLRADLRPLPGRSDKVKDRAKIFFGEKKRKQPLGERTLGCVFKNPPGDLPEAGMLIERCGMKGFREGGAMISEKHANFIVNRSCATSADVKKLIGKIKREVMSRFSIALETEIEILGESSSEGIHVH